MAKKKDDNIKEDIKVAEEKAQTEETVEPTPLELAEKAAAEFKDMALRARADFENYRKNNLNLAASVRERTLAEVIGEVLLVVDNFDRAEQSVKDKDAKEGLKLIRGQLEALLKRYEVEPFSSVGEDFNPELHDCIMHVPSPDKVNKVLYEIARGYKMNGKVLRYAVVAVGAEEEKSDDNNEQNDNKSEN